MSNKSQRPLSPHLQVYKPQMTSVLSILHRATGYALAVGTVMVVWWLVAAATGEAAYNNAMNFSGTKIGTLMIFGWSFAMFYHMCNGIRHLIWDTGRLMKMKHAKMAGYVVLLVSTAMTISVWCCAGDWWDKF